jgi:hypothetical protein
MSNIIKFPTTYDGSLPNTKKQVKKKVTNIRKEYIDEVLDDIVENVIYDMDRYGFHRLKTEDIAYMREIINAALCRSAKIDHFFHETIDKTVVVLGDEEEKKPVD